MIRFTDVTEEQKSKVAVPVAKKAPVAQVEALAAEEPVSEKPAAKRKIAKPARAKIASKKA